MSARAAELRRRRLMAESDGLLDQVEMLRLSDSTSAPVRLREAVRAMQIRIGRRNPPLPAATLDAVHDLVFAVQQRLMAANPRIPRPARHHGRPTGQPIVTSVRRGRKWKVLTLPAPTLDGDDGEWLELVDSTVERAWDRWCYAQQHAIRAARLRTRARLALAVATAAWDNYWMLLQEADRIRIVLGRPAEESAAARWR
ncbi:MAG TPA: hypothetical protein VI172_11955 [Candidatus Dormibacteraeota bacterium]|jgi:hypothetical protein